MFLKLCNENVRLSNCLYDKYTNSNFHSKNWFSINFDNDNFKNNSNKLHHYKRMSKCTYSFNKYILNPQKTTITVINNNNSMLFKIFVQENQSSLVFKQFESIFTKSVKEVFISSDKRIF